MTRFARIIVSTCVLSILTGCNQPRQQPSLDQIKIGDLAPTHGKQPESQVLPTIGIDVAVFEVPVEKLGSLDNIWSLLDANQVRLADADAFAKNTFRIGIGSFRTLARVVDALQAAEGKNVGSTLLLIPDGQAEFLNVARLPPRTIVSYFASARSLEHRQLGPGALGLRLVARKLADSQNLCNIQAAPVFSISTEGLVPQLAERMKSSEFRFASAGFGLRMRIGDFILLAPAGHIEKNNKLGGLFFSPSGDRPVIRVYVLVCRKIV